MATFHVVACFDRGWLTYRGPIFNTVEEARRDDAERTVVQAHRFELIDEAGRVRAILGDVFDKKSYVPGWRCSTGRASPHGLRTFALGADAYFSSWRERGARLGCRRR